MTAIRSPSALASSLELVKITMQRLFFSESMNRQAVRVSGTESPVVGSSRITTYMGVSSEPVVCSFMRMI
jgi:hypothetical protein